MKNERRSFWVIQLAKARQTSEWHEVPRYFTRKTAKQLCSDLRNGRRVNGLKPTEEWQTKWEGDDNPANDHLVKIYIKYWGEYADS